MVGGATLRFTACAELAWRFPCARRRPCRMRVCVSRHGFARPATRCITTRTYEPRLMKPADVYAMIVSCVVPRPIALVTSLCSNGETNCAPFSFFNGVCSRPPCISISITAGRKGTKASFLCVILLFVFGCGC